MKSRSAIFRRLGASAASPVDPKHWRDAKTLADLCGRAQPPRPRHAARTPLCIDIRQVCTRCELSRSPNFPLAPKRDIFAVLGYV
jgi:hypothetical protein